MFCVYAMLIVYASTHKPIPSDRANLFYLNILSTYLLLIKYCLFSIYTFLLALFFIHWKGSDCHVETSSVFMQRSFLRSVCKTTLQPYTFFFHTKLKNTWTLSLNERQANCNSFSRSNQFKLRLFCFQQNPLGRFIDRREKG